MRYPTNDRMHLDFLLQTSVSSSPHQPRLSPSPSWADHSDNSSTPAVSPSPCPSPPPLAIDHLANAAVQAAMHLQLQQPHPSPPSRSPSPSLTPPHLALQPPPASLPPFPTDNPHKRRRVSGIPVSPVSSSSHSILEPSPTVPDSHPPADSPITPATPIPSTSRNHVCPHCQTSFSLKVRFLHHLYSEHNTVVYDSRTILPCHKCPSAFLRNTDRSKHDLCVHQRLRPYRCTAAGCNSAFFFEKDLVKHRSTVHLRHKPFRCPICPKAFGKREHMTSHVKRVHHKLRPFRCDVCDIRLASKYNLQGHLKTAAHAAAESLCRKAAVTAAATANSSVEARSERAAADDSVPNVPTAV